MVAAMAAVERVAAVRVEAVMARRRKTIGEQAGAIGRMVLRL